jgi:AraC family transcriptional regulator of adaptative response / DNA-3-methyladenine glycosylase II
MATPTQELERWQRAVASRDPRFDGWFYLGVTSTGIYCRPSCPAAVPKREHMRFFRSAASAQRSGFRACKRCRPDAAPGSPEWNMRADLVARAMRLIGDGVVDREGVGGLSRRLGYSERQLNRQLTAELGAGPLALARAQRAQTARVLVETTDLPFSDVALSAGFASIRQFNETVREVFALSPTELRRKARTAAPAAGGALSLRLAHRAPFACARLLAFLALRAVPGVEESRDDGTFRRTLRLEHGAGIVELRDGVGHVACRLTLDDPRDLAPAVARCRRLLDLDADPVAVDGTLRGDPLLRRLVARVPGIRVPGAVDGGELALRAVLGQQVSVAAARTHAARLVQAVGEPLPAGDGGLTHLFPSAEAVAACDPAVLAMPASRRRTVAAVASALRDGALVLDPGADRAGARGALLALPGIGPWTAEYVAMRALGDPDAFPASDLGVRNALVRLAADGRPAAAAARAERWRPWRAYAVQHLWAALEAPPSRHPTARSAR